MFEIEHVDQIAVIRMSHGKVNAMNIEFCEQLTKTLIELGKESAPAVVFTSSGRAFSAGVDLIRLVEEDADYTVRFLDQLSNVFHALFEFPKPLVACINGAAIAGGCIMASACDYRVIVPRAKIGIPELRIGVPLPMIAIEIMRFVTAPQRFQDMVNIGSTFTGQTAVDVGLADEVAERDQGVDAAIEKAKQLATIPSEVFAITKQQLRQPILDLAEKGNGRFREQMVAMWTSDEIRAVINQYVADRLKK